jgi:D-aspartate ligase
MTTSSGTAATASFEAEHLPACGGALVIGGDHRGLGVARSLGRRGIPVWVLFGEHLVATKSRFSTRCLPWPSSEAEQIGYLLQLSDRHQLRGWMLFPTTDDTVELIARHHELLASHYQLTTPPWEITRWAFDKRQTYELAQQVGVDCPWTYYPRSRADLERLERPMPLILKPAYHKGNSRFSHDKAWLVHDRAELLTRYDEACTMVSPETIMVQEFIPGGGDTQYSYAALYRDGQPQAEITARRTRQYPIDFGHAGTYVESIENPELLAAGRRVLSAINFQGLAEMDFKRDAASGRFSLLDINPRVWGWHSLAQRAGIDFPYLLWRLTLGQPIAAQRARVGVRWVRFPTDFAAALQLFRHGALSPWEYLASLKGPLEPAVFALDDPLPALMDVPIMMRMLMQRAARRAHV